MIKSINNFFILFLTHFERSIKRMENLKINALPNGYTGIFAAIPFAIWFFLGIEGVANVAEETKNPQRDISKGFGWGIFTLVVLCVLVFISTIGIGGWEAIVYKNGKSALVVFGSSDANVYSLDAKTGNLKWKFKTNWCKCFPLCII